MLADLTTAASAATDLKAVPAVLDPTHAYVLIDMVGDPPTPGQPAVTLARYDRERQDVAGSGRAVSRPVPAGEDVRVTTSLTRSLRAKGNGGLHLLEVTPGIWTIEGVGSAVGSLGSYSFELPAGQVTDLGVFSTRLTDYKGDPIAGLTAGRVFKILLMSQILKQPHMTSTVTIRTRRADDPTIPPAIAALTPHAAILTAGARFGNYLGGIVDRIDDGTVIAGQTGKN
jgi:hypothetical protein